MNWLTPDPPADWRPCGLQVRYNSSAAPARVRINASGELEARFDEPLSAVTPGQAVVAYDGDRVLGGGWVRSVSRAGR